MSQELTTLSLADLSRKIQARDVSPIEVMDACLSRIEKLNPRLNAFLHVAPEQARTAAKKAADALDKGDNRGPLHGIPVGVKDLIDVAGMPTTAGSSFLKDNVPLVSAPVVDALRRAGAIIVGKTHLHEFAVGATNINPHFGPAHNPWNTDLSPGGSSGGSAVAVAAGMVPLALGTDTGGSVRVPSAICGLTGLRPVIGGVDTQGVVAMSHTLDTVGPMAHTAYDVALAMDAISTETLAQHTLGLSDELYGVRIGLIADDLFWDQTDEEVNVAVREAVKVLKELGAEVVDVRLPRVDDTMNAQKIIALGEAAWLHRERLAENPEGFGEDVRARLTEALEFSAVDYIGAQVTRKMWRSTLRRVLVGVDVLISPSTVTVRHPIEDSEGVTAARSLLRTAYPFSLSGLPGLSVPCGQTSDGLPVGMQLVAAHTSKVLHTAHRYQKATNWHKRRPNI